jgi:AraC-like DNA-binding protein
MKTRRQERPLRTFTHADRQRFSLAADHYLWKCYKRKSAARASEFAAELGLTPEYLSARCRQLFGKSLRAYLREKQAAYAARLLHMMPAAEITVEEIAVMAAFGTPSTLYRCFREVYGTTPAAFRDLKN